MADLDVAELRRGRRARLVPHVRSARRHRHAGPLRPPPGRRPRLPDPRVAGRQALPRRRVVGRLLRLRDGPARRGRGGERRPGRRHPPGLAAAARRRAAGRAEAPGRAAAAFDARATTRRRSTSSASTARSTTCRPSELGTFDFVFMGNILLHLADPARALRAVRSVTVPAGTLLSYEAISLPMTVLRPRTPDGAALARGPRAVVDARTWPATGACSTPAGGRSSDTGGPLFQPFGAPHADVARSRPAPAAGVGVLDVHPPVRRRHRVGARAVPPRHDLSSAAERVVDDGAQRERGMRPAPRSPRSSPPTAGPRFLPGLVAALEAQDLPQGEAEVVLRRQRVAATTRGTSSARLVARHPARRSLAVASTENHGPAPGRNAGVGPRARSARRHHRRRLPAHAGLARAACARRSTGGADVVQGTVRGRPQPASTDLGPWDHTIWVTPPTPFFETCNVSYRRTRLRAGRAASTRTIRCCTRPAVGPSVRTRAWPGRCSARAATAAFAPDAVVHHRCLPGTYRRWLADQRQLSGSRGWPAGARWSRAG